VVGSTAIRGNLATANPSGRASAAGGGVAIVALFRATLQFQGSSLAENRANAVNGLAEGGGVFVYCQGGGATAELLFERSGAVFNVASGASAGGGFASFFTEGGSAQSHVLLRNSTLARNTSSAEAAEGRGGALHVSSTGGGAQARVELSNVTLALNRASTAGGAFWVNAEGGGATEGIGIRNSIVWGNVAPSDADCPSRTPIDAGGHSVLGSLACLFVRGLPGFIAADPLLGEIDETVTPVLRPTSLSPAIDLGDPAGCRDERGIALGSDQLGVPRPQGLRCDAGAVEFETLN
jgi:hypothetical protein